MLTYFSQWDITAKTNRSAAKAVGVTVEQLFDAMCTLQTQLK